MFKVSKLRVLTIVMVLSLFLALPMTTQALPMAAEIWVSSETGQDTNNGANDAPVATLGKALALASTTDPTTIYLMAGDYIAPADTLTQQNLTITAYYSSELARYDTVTIHPDYSYSGGSLLGMFTGRWIFDFRNVLGSFRLEEVTLSGDDLSTSDTVEDGSDVTGVHAYSIDNAGANITVEGCTFENLQFGFQEEHSDDLDVTLRNNTITADHPVRINSEGTSTLIIDGNELTKTSPNSTDVVLSLDYPRADTQILNNTIDGGSSGQGRGIYDEFARGTISGNHFVNLDNALELTDVLSLNVSDNIFEMTNGNAIHIDMNYYALGNLTVADNTIKSMVGTGDNGIVIDIDRNSSLPGNGDYTITGNTIKNFAYGIRFNNDSEAKPENLVVGGTAGNENIFAGNIFNFYCDYASETLPFDLTHNDWNTTDSAIILKKLNIMNQNAENKIKYILLDDPFTTNALNEVWVDDSYSPSSSEFGISDFNTITEGKASVRIGGTVHIAAGLYDEQVFIFDPVGLQGNGAETIIKNTAGHDEAAVISIIASDVRIEDLNITGGYNGIFLGDMGSVGSSLNSPVSVYGYSSIPDRALIINNFFTNQSPAGEYGSAFGILINLSSYGISDLNIRSNVFDNDRFLTSYAICQNTQLLTDPIIQFNQILHGYQNGMFISTDGTALIQNNTFSISEPSLGIHLQTYGSATVKNNSILDPDGPFNNSNYGLFISANGPVPAEETYRYQVENNIISGFNYGIMFYNNTSGNVPEVVIGGETAKYNDLRNNPLALMNGAPTVTIDASYNIWGVSDAEIPGSILDSIDNAGSYGPVTYLPSMAALSTEASLSSLTASGINLTPLFSSDTNSYSASADNSVSSTTVTAAPADNNATVSINGVVGTSREIPLTIGSNAVTVDVTAEDGVTAKTYTITISRASIDDGDNNGSSGGGSSYSPPTVDLLRVSMPQGEFDSIASDSQADYTIRNQSISITFDGRALDAIANAGSGTVVVTANNVDIDTLSAADQAKVQGRPVYDFTVINGNQLVANFGGGQATISIPYTLISGENPNAVIIYYLSDDGTLEPIRGRYDPVTKSVVFTTLHFSHFVIGYNQVSFSDVPTGAWYKNAVEFIAARSITTGTDDSHFSPGSELSRGQFVVMLMNAYQLGSNPSNAVQDANFDDAGNAYYTDYLAQAKKLGISNGIGGNLFAPEQAISRQEMFVMLHNALQTIDQLPADTNEKALHTFNDANQVAVWANDGMASLVKSGVISGSGNQLHPAATTTRAEMAQMLYNLLSK